MSKLGKATILLMMATIISKILGFGRELVLASSYGATSYSDAYLIALNIPTAIFMSIGQAISTTFIPLYYEAEEKEGSNRSLDFLNSLIHIIIIICIIVTALGILFSESLVKLFALGFEGEVLQVASSFTKILMIGIIGVSLSNLMSATLQTKNNFIIPGIVSIPYNIIIIISIILSMKFGINVMVWGTTIGMISQAVFQIPFIYKYGYKYNFRLNIRDKYLKKMISLLGPVFIGIAVTQINILVDRTLASTLVEGSISALNYANRLNGFVMGLFITSICAVIYPSLSKISVRDEYKTFSKLITKSINSVILLILPVMVGAIILSKPIVKILFERGAFDESATNMTSIALICYSLGLLGMGVRDILSRVFYSLKDTKTPMINGAIAMVINVILNIILIKKYKHAGLAIATSISATLATILLFYSLYKKIGNFGQRKILILFLKSLIASGIMGGGTLFTYKSITAFLYGSFINDILALVISIIVGAISYGLCIIILRVEEVNIVISYIKNLKNKSNI